MQQRTQSLKNNEGFVVVVAIFTLALLSVIGTAAMMTSSVETEIAGNDKFYKMAFYQSETGLTMAGEVIEALEAYDEVNDNYTFASLTMHGNDSDIEVIDGDFLFEGRDTYNGEWDNHIDEICGTGTDAGPDIKIISSDFNVEVDVDKITVGFLAGSGVEFAAGADGIGVSAHKVIYNVDAIGRLPQNPGGAQVENLMGFRYVPR